MLPKWTGPDAQLLALQLWLTDTWLGWLTDLLEEPLRDWSTSGSQKKVVNMKFKVLFHHYGCWWWSLSFFIRHRYCQFGFKAWLSHWLICRSWWKRHCLEKVGCANLLLCLTAGPHFDTSIPTSFYPLVSVLVYWSASPLVNNACGRWF